MKISYGDTKTRVSLKIYICVLSNIWVLGEPEFCPKRSKKSLPYAQDIHKRLTSLITSLNVNINSTSHFYISPWFDSCLSWTLSPLDYEQPLGPLGPDGTLAIKITYAKNFCEFYGVPGQLADHVEDMANMMKVSGGSTNRQGVVEGVGLSDELVFLY